MKDGTTFCVIQTFGDGFSGFYVYGYASERRIWVSVGDLDGPVHVAFVVHGYRSSRCRSAPSSSG